MALHTLNHFQIVAAVKGCLLAQQTVIGTGGISQVGVRQTVFTQTKSRDFSPQFYCPSRPGVKEKHFSAYQLYTASIKRALLLVSTIPSFRGALL